MSKLVALPYGLFINYIASKKIILNKIGIKNTPKLSVFIGVYQAFSTAKISSRTVSMSLVPSNW